MSSKLCIISEYNPFHFGHLYHLNESISKTNADYKIAIISGNFVQRGEPSIINKWEKAKVALAAGFDLVIELPTLYAVSSAENFANGAIKIASQIKSNYISFGTESGDLEKLKELSSLINKNEKKYISKVLGRITFMGAFFIALLASIPTIFTALTGLPETVKLGGTSMLIAVGVLLETYKQLESSVASRNYSNRR